MTDQKVDLYDANKGLLPRSGGPYLDEVEMEKAEERRAFVEGRKPDLKNPPPIVGTPLVPRQYLKEKDTDHGHEALADNVELVNKPVASYIVPEPVNEADPTQADFDWDMQKQAALEAKKKLEEAKVTSSKTTEELLND